ncbi:hypothetical protein L2E82_08203 [Cichorium intybus]|uniref:Uncharacterized protein n=1 Tax=Cichorium intybus TaxID=13427 RepID=A0ACB9G6Y6_CICIN|nr:hypothetical protein L2E82_08203 [Cichorium intybus]
MEKNHFLNASSSADKFDFLKSFPCTLNLTYKSGKHSPHRWRFSKLFNFLKLYLLRRLNMGYTKGLFSGITTAGEPIVKKLAAVSVFGVLPGAMIASLIYSPPDFIYNRSNSPKSTK